MVSGTNDKYPPLIICELIDDFTETQEEYLEWAKFDKNLTELNQGLGFYQCYCKEYSEPMDAKDKDAFCQNY